MKTFFFCFPAALCFLGVAQAEEPQSALQALRILPKSDAANVARVVARGGNPAPERWHFIVYDGAARKGFRECVVVAREIVASREVSQFANQLKLEEVVGESLIKIDSDKVARLAHEFAEANQMRIATIDYDLSKDGEKAVPLWKLNCLDENGVALGELSVTATQGTVISHEGFVIEPSRKTAQAPAVKSKPEPKREPARQASKTNPSSKETTAAKAKKKTPAVVEKVASASNGNEAPQNSPAQKPWLGRRLFNRVLQR